MKSTMCSNEDLQKEMASIEDKMFASHNAIAQTISNVGADVKILRETLIAHMGDEDEKLKKMTSHLTSKLDEYIASDLKWKVGVDTYMAEMLPVKDGVRTVQSLNKFIKWLGFPALGALIAYWVMK